MILRMIPLLKGRFTRLPGKAMLLLACGFLLLPVLAGAQQVTVRGKVTDASSGEGIPGANVVVKGTTTGTITNVDGDFTLSVPTSNATLVVTFVAMPTRRFLWLAGQPYPSTWSRRPRNLMRSLLWGTARHGEPISRDPLPPSPGMNYRKFPWPVPPMPLRGACLASMC